MGIGMLALYAALAVVALWLIAELLLQNRAPLRWRALALGGFLAVVAGMAVPSVLVIGAGAAAFAAGQLLVTLAVKRGYRAGWSLRRPDGTLPGPLAGVPLLAAATSGAPAPAVQQEQDRVGEVGPVEPAPVAPVAEPAEEPVEYGIYETVEAYQEPVAQLPQPVQAGYPYTEQQQYEYQQYGYYEQQQQQQQYVPYEPQWQQQSYDPAQYQPEYGIPQQQAYPYYPEQQQPEQQAQPQPEQHWQGWHS
ncbi:hypothetical protein C7C46_03280 [Streptomyces tateyamensis]|uniref:Uncharacterized protein n=1 Tax=Streptomyces tateyamensis TaxID=565073 RepID=A0A2V4NQ33_9ACTN|nr:hypothetical protein [Streptomyces tateyamensis]PYC87782.1 hypothetical protein C7C46_03280 [Streptomyces tateyamensis]